MPGFNQPWQVTGILQPRLPVGLRQAGRADMQRLAKAGAGPGPRSGMQSRSSPVAAAAAANFMINFKFKAFKPVTRWRAVTVTRTGRTGRMSVRACAATEPLAQSRVVAAVLLQPQQRGPGRPSDDNCTAPARPRCLLSQGRGVTASGSHCGTVTPNSDGRPLATQPRPPDQSVPGKISD